jgi:hypothetical protein
MRRGTRGLALVVAAVAGALIGVISSFALDDVVSPGGPAPDPGFDDWSGPGATDPEPVPNRPEEVDQHADEPAQAEQPAQAEPPAQADRSEQDGVGPSLGDDVLLVWTAGGLPAGLEPVVADMAGVEAATTVQGDEAGLVRSTDPTGQVVDELADGWTIPLDVLAVEPETFAGFVRGRSHRLVAELRPGEALLTRTSAQLRRLDSGSSIELTTGVVRVVGVIGDAAGAGAELIVHRADAGGLGVAAERYVLLRHDGSRNVVQDELAAGYLAGRTIRFRSPAETAWLRHGDAVAPHALVKAAFGEFAVRDLAGRQLEIDEEFIDRFVTTERVPVLGEVTCHRRILRQLDAAMAELVDANLDHLVDPGAFAGCWSPRRMAPAQPVSRHAWGIALDINVRGNPRGSFSTQDPRLVETMLRHGFTWGGTWLVPDPAHYEALARS